MIESAYAILRVARDASPEEVRKAYVTLARRYPPEHFPEKFMSVRRAYQELTLDDDYIEELTPRIRPKDTGALELAGWLWGDREELKPQGGKANSKENFKENLEDALRSAVGLLAGKNIKRELDPLLESAASEIEWRI